MKQNLPLAARIQNPEHALSLILSFSISKMVAQDTIFYKKEKGGHITFIKDGYHIYALLQKKRIKQVDTVFCYKYGAYLGTKIKDAALYDNVFIFIYEGCEGMFFASHKLKKNRWEPIVGGYLFFFAQGEKHDYLVSILTREKFEVRKGSKRNIYLLDHEKKAISVLKQ